MSKADVGGALNLGGGEAVGESAGVPVNEELLWKARAEEAEEQVEALGARVLELEAALAEAEESIARVERLGEIDRELTAARAVDIETARMLTEAVIAQMDEPDVGLAVRDLCERKPFLFACHRQGSGGGVSMSPSARTDDAGSLGTMAQRARSSGDRAELLRYLRARRVV